jgi:hypothetical protein
MRLISLDGFAHPRKLRKVAEKTGVIIDLARKKLHGATPFPIFPELL